ncbi:hypothetical protein BDN72DRAFT_530210 [Pluteus cervinus]|uniref:Uncharacterized protein n=1 Tax=Pluteus cervinus TaxID=181527 RepID=A0ACD3AYP8_9AGAR|nr:hypothetical protein BDN72DRAFT_530210 [Pluteus cervinus]
MENGSHDLLSSNPFIDDDELTAGPSHSVHYSSALNPNLLGSSFRRRRSNSGGGVESSNGAGPRIGLSPRKRGSQHPLRPPSGALIEEDAGVTRPHLSRIVNAPLVDAPPVEPLVRNTSQSSREEKEVLVHQVTDKDSLAGVSLKYGISMADLRKANKLWASDSIHLRSVLYIPVECSARAKEYLIEANLISMTPPRQDTAYPINSGDPSTSLIDDNDGRSSQDQAPLDVPSATSMGTIRRIPASELSFFPPPSSTSLSTKTTANSGALQTNSLDVQQDQFLHNGVSMHSHPGPTRGHVRHLSGPSHSLSSLLTALPISLSTRDTLISRFSFESTNSSLSDSTFDEDETIHERHELYQVNTHSQRIAYSFYGDKPNEGANATTPQPAMVTPKNPTVPLSSSYYPSSQMQPYYRHSRVGSSPPNSYVPMPGPVRTVQVEPSPVMQLPQLRAGSSRRRVGHSKSQEVLGYELQGTGKRTVPANGLLL